MNIKNIIWVYLLKNNSRFDFVIHMVTIALKSRVIKNTKLKNLGRKLNSILHPLVPTFQDDSELPEIILTIDCAEKDLLHLNLVINNSLRNVLNPVKMVEIIVPKNILTLCTDIIQSFEFSVPVRVKCEEAVLSLQLLSKIRKYYPDRAGWLIHQFLTIQQVINNKHVAGVLSVDSDTFLLSPIAWLSKSGEQVLMESLEWHSPYYTFLHQIHPEFKSLNRSHVTHHSFFQPTILLSIFSKLGIDNLDTLFDLVLEKSNSGGICIDRELYAYGLISYFPSRYEYVKWSNFPLKTNLLDDELDLYLKNLGKTYKSASAHHYLQF
jgi:hypothetical protein